MELRDPSGGLIGVLNGHDRAVTVSSGRGGLVATAGQDDTIRLWNVPLRREIDVLTLDTWNAKSLTLSPKGLVAYRPTRDCGCGSRISDDHA